MYTPAAYPTHAERTAPHKKSRNPDGLRLTLLKNCYQTYTDTPVLDNAKLGTTT
jgi:hypothetical protein